ncbi:MAG: hypothetical protein ACYDDI_12315 [Candidatus Acidiferrales bacterium]
MKQESSVRKVSQKEWYQPRISWEVETGVRKASERKLVRKHGIGGNSSVGDDAEAARRRLGLLVVLYLF